MIPVKWHVTTLPPKSCEHVYQFAKDPEGLAITHIRVVCHVYPRPDKPPHTLSTKCWCRPELQVADETGCASATHFHSSERPHAT